MKPLLPPLRTPQIAPHPLRSLLAAAALCVSPALDAAVGTVNLSSNQPAKPERKPPASLASLPAPRIAGPLRILLVDDDASANNVGGPKSATPDSDDIYRALVASAVNGQAEAWAVDVVKGRDAGPPLERMRAFNVILWYTGGAYGANTDTVGREDEENLRRYLQEVGGAVILVSSGYVNNLVYGQNWEAAEHPFLKEVIGVNGCYGLAQRFSAGAVQAHDGSRFTVAHPGPAETQFSVVNPDGAAIVFTSPLQTSYVTPQEGGLPVAVANAFGGGRIVYVGFTLENIPAPELTRAFDLVLNAATGRSGAASAPPAAVAPKTPVLAVPPTATRTPPPAAPATAPPVTRMPVGAATQGTPARLDPNVPPVSAPPAEPTPPAAHPPPAQPPSTSSADNSNKNRKLLSRGQPYIRTVRVKLYTGNDNKEAPSGVTVRLFMNGGDTSPDPSNPEGLNPLTLPVSLPQEEFKVNTAQEFVVKDDKMFEFVRANSWGEQDRLTLALSQQYGLRFQIEYQPNFPLDAWKIERVDLEVDYGYWESWLVTFAYNNKTENVWEEKTAPGFPKTITFLKPTLLNASNNRLTLYTDRFFLPR
ncbi:MAG: hypothetical protein JNG83_02960 [Opitutaceae bacterium]|nr:hypothetical protein [Opitutaceae bacterium]